MYALNLAEDGRILSATYPQYAAEGQPLVDELPTGETEEEKDIHNWLLHDGVYIFDPIPEPVEPEMEATTDEVLNAMLGVTA